MKSTFFGLVLSIILCSAVHAQQNLTLFLMHDLPQANIVNPAVTARCKVNFGMPGLASIHVNYANTAFTASDLLVRDGDSLYFQPGDVIDGMNNKELFATEVHYTPISMGIWIKDRYFTFSISEKVTAYNTVPKELAQLGWYGNTMFLGKDAKFDGLRVNANHYREYAIGMAKEKEPGLVFGYRAKLLFGKGNVYTPKTTGRLYTNPNNYSLMVELNSTINTSFPIEVTTDDEGYVSDIQLQEDVDWMAYMMNRRNLGIGFDFGFIYQMDERTTISGSILDVGFINWKTDTWSFESLGDFEYSGTGNEDGFNSPDYFSELGDDLEDEFTPIPISRNYTSSLVPQIYLGATRTLTDHLNTGVVLRNEIYKNKLHPAFTLSANTYNYKTLNGSLSYSAINGEYLNIGAGFGVKMGAFHIHAITDDLFAFFDVTKTRGANLRFGFTFMPGCNPDKMRLSSKGIQALPCYHSPYKGEKTSRKKKRR